MAWVIWITGLPGSGKSTLAEAIKRKVSEAVILRMDEVRKVITPKPSYSDTEREYVYRALVYMAKTLYELGHNVIIDATGHKRRWRQLARKFIPNFFECYLKCPVNLCIKREAERIDTHAAPMGIYKKGKKGWPVPGIKVPYERPLKPEIIIDTVRECPAGAADKAVKALKKLKIL